MKALSGIKDKFAKEKFSVGLDIGAVSAKTVKLRLFKEKFELSDYKIEQTLGDLDEFLKKISHQQEIKRVNIALSGQSVILRYVNFPKMQQDELKKALRFEAQKHIPFSLNDVNLDSYILKSDLPDNKMLVVLAAVKKDFLNQRIKSFESAGLTVNMVDVDSLSLINAFEYNYSDEQNLKNKTIALLNIGAIQSNLNILEGILPRLSRDIAMAGSFFTQKIADVLSLDFKAAENLKLNPDKERLEKTCLAVEAALASLAGEIRVSFDYYESQSASSVSKMFLSGAGSLFGGLKDTLAGLLDIEVEYWDPFKRIELSSNINAEKLKAESSKFAVATGLALRL